MFPPSRPSKSNPNIGPLEVPSQTKENLANFDRQLRASPDTVAACIAALSSLRYRNIAIRYYLESQSSLKIAADLGEEHAQVQREIRIIRLIFMKSTLGFFRKR